MVLASEIGAHEQLHEVVAVLVGYGSLLLLCGTQPLIQTAHVIQDVHLTFGWRLKTELLDRLLLSIFVVFLFLFLRLAALVGIETQQIHLLVVLLLLSLILYLLFQPILQYSSRPLLFVTISIVIEFLLLLLLLLLFFFGCHT